MRFGLIILAIIAALAIFGVTSYNGMVTRQQAVQTAWAQVENVYQRRADLIPNLVSTVKGYAAFEKSTLTQVIQARAGAVQTQQSIPNNAVPTQAQIQQMDAAQSGLGAALGRLMVVVERYPDLKASQNFLALQAELAGTENRIAVERRRFNEVAQNYNTSILTFPQNFFARIFGFNPTGYFASKAGAEVAPKVDFSQ